MDGGGNQYFEEATAERGPLLESKQDLMLMENNLDLQDDIIAEREKGIAEIQGNMLEINEMFRDLNTIVIEQAPLVDSIENHIEHARFDVEKGVEEIEKASTHQKSAGGKTRMIACILILVMIVIIMIALLAVFVFN